MQSATPTSAQPDSTSQPHAQQIAQDQGPGPANASAPLNVAIPAHNPAMASPAVAPIPAPAPIATPRADVSSLSTPAPGTLTPIAGPAPTPHHVTVERGCQKKTRLVWTPELHTRFLLAVEKIGLRTAVPRTILQVMDVDGLTRENIASHLQKYRRLLERRAGLTGPVAQKDWPKLLQAQVSHLAQVKKQIAEGGHGGGAYEGMAVASVSTQPMHSAPLPHQAPQRSQSQQHPQSAPPPQPQHAQQPQPQQPLQPTQSAHANVAQHATAGPSAAMQADLSPVIVDPLAAHENAPPPHDVFGPAIPGPSHSPVPIPGMAPGICPVPAQIPPQASVPMTADLNGQVTGVPLPRPFTPPLMCVMPQPDGSPMLLPMLPAMYMAACGKNTPEFMGRVPLQSTNNMYGGGFGGMPGAVGGAPAPHHSGPPGGAGLCQHPSEGGFAAGYSGGAGPSMSPQAFGGTSHFGGSQRGSNSAPGFGSRGGGGVRSTLPPLVSPQEQAVPSHALSPVPDPPIPVARTTGLRTPKRTTPRGGGGGSGGAAAASAASKARSGRDAGGVLASGSGKASLRVVKSETAVLQQQPLPKDRARGSAGDVRIKAEPLSMPDHDLGMDLDACLPPVKVEEGTGTSGSGEEGSPRRRCGVSGSDTGSGVRGAAAAAREASGGIADALKGTLSLATPDAGGGGNGGGRAVSEVVTDAAGRAPDPEAAGPAPQHCVSHEIAEGEASGPDPCDMDHD